MIEAVNEAAAPVDAEYTAKALADVERDTLLRRIRDLEEENERVRSSQRWFMDRAVELETDRNAWAKRAHDDEARHINYRAAHACIPRSSAVKLSVVLLLAAKAIGRRNADVTARIKLAHNEIKWALKESAK